MLCWSCATENPTLIKDKEVILVRKIGHEILKYTGDSTSSISPIKELSPSNYQLDFQLPFSFVSDTIIHIIDREMKKYSSDEYIVKVNSCSLDELVFSYFISPVENDDLVSCLGRNQKEDCYNIQLKFLHDEGRSNYAVASFIGIPILMLLFYFLWRNRKTHVPPVEESLYEVEATSKNESVNNIGQFSFNFDEQYLQFHGKKEPLTYKEAKILSILNLQINDVVTREALLKEVWEDEGLMVSRSLDMFISKLRKKLKADSSVQIINIHGIGYKLISS
ncbi:hypothetical protein GCM10007940_00450 [Portibacter lacus]|uniref:OmpR/PhoB-type domain-containing protein n=2 Tax=Portibacter lacus TaxID=1099794 RepID=A0AA37SJZ3_9BACT|nr:hypothetical protein GCM10007940_00450 [Portibacter lacus]